MSSQALTSKQSKWTHIFFVAIGVMIGLWGFGSIDDSLARPLGSGASWQSGAIIVLFSGMILGVAFNNLFKIFRMQRKPEE